MEAYEVENADIKDKDHRYDYSHLILLAKNNEGLKNLMLIHNDAQTRGFYGKPRTDRKMLQEHGKGIIGLSACVAGSIPQAILNDQEDKAIELIQFYKECFDEFFLEIQPGTFEQQLKVNDRLVVLAIHTETPLVVTNDIHYLNEQDYKVHDYHVKLGRKKDKEDFSEDTLVYPDTCYWFMNEDTLKNTVTYTKLVTPKIIETALSNAEYIINSCNVDLTTHACMPKFCDNEEEVLTQLCIEKLEQLPQTNSEYRDRLEYELSVIVQKGFSGYFLIVNDFVQWARDNNLRISYARGSGGGSLVTYLLGITAPDPIHYGLYFERFLDPHRESSPDLDIDISGEDRDKLFQYILDKYGQDHCAQIATVHVRKAKGAIKDAGRILGILVDICDTISKLIPTVYYDDNDEKQTDLSIEESLRVEPDLLPFKDEYPELFELASSLEGLSSSIGIHAAGIGISPVPLTDTVPLIQQKNGIVPATSLTLKDAEKFMVKMDLLGLDTINVIKQTEEELGVHLDITNPDNLTDPKVWKLIGSSNTAGVFQLSSNTYKRRMGRLRPKTILELAACLALIRGPCIAAKTDELYIDIVQGKVEVQKIHPIYDKITETTKGIILYQEQTMQLAAAVGMDLTEGYRLVKAIAKKHPEQIAEYKTKFLEGAVSKGVSIATAKYIFKQIELSGLYSFNKSHAVTYALISYWSAWLKVYYTVPYMCNIVTNKYLNSAKEISATIQNCKNNKIGFLLPDINKSEWFCTVEDNKIRLGLCTIKGLGEKAADHLIEKRQGHGPFLNLQDFLDTIEKRSFNKTKVIAAIFANLFNSIEEKDSYALYQKYCTDNKIEPEDKYKLAKDCTITTKTGMSQANQKAIFSAVIV